MISNFSIKQDGNFSTNVHLDCDCKDFKNKCPKIDQNSESNGSIQAIQDEVFNCKSVAIYTTWKNRFSEFLEKEERKESLESVLIFMKNLSGKYAPSTLWQAYSCLNKYYTTYKNWKSFNEVPILKSFIKAIEKKGQPKQQSKVISKEDIFKFFDADHNEQPQLLAKKVVALIGYYGGLRCVELVNLLFSEVKVSANEITIHVRSSKTHPTGKYSFFSLSLNSRMMDKVLMKWCLSITTKLMTKMGDFSEISITNQKNSHLNQWVVMP